MANIKVIYCLLLEGNYLGKRQGNRSSYAIYSGKANPIHVVTDANYRALYHLIKTDKKGRMTLNLTSVRGLHGNDWFKKEYKKFFQSKKSTQ